jgi:hypothetical protein
MAMPLFYIATMPHPGLGKTASIGMGLLAWAMGGPITLLSSYGWGIEFYSLYDGSAGRVHKRRTARTFLVG